MRVALNIAFLTTVGLALPARAQDLASLQQGVRIRVQPVVGDRETGTYLGVSSDSLRFFREKTQSASGAIPIEQVRALQVSNGRSHGRGLLKGALIGTGIGIATGAILGAVTYSDGDDQGGWGCLIICSRGEAAAFSAAILGTGGLVVGSVYGAMRGSETWKPVPLDRRVEPRG